MRILPIATLLLCFGCASPDTRPAVEALVAEGQQREKPKLELKVKTVATELPAPGKGYRIGVNDVLDVRVPGLKGFGGDLTRADARAFGYTVMEDGKVYLPYVRGIAAKGRTALEVQAELGETMQKFLKDPVVLVRVLRYESQKFFVLGGVEEPGAFPVDGITTLLQGIGDAAGIRDGADIERAFVVRGSTLLPISLGDLLLRGDTSRNIVMEHGDLVYVPAEIRQEVYVLGEVVKPGRLPISPFRRMTLAAALSEAGGIDRLYASKKEIRVFRGSWQAPQSFTVTEQDVNNYGAHIFLESGDVIHVAPSGLANWNRTLTLLLPFSGTAASLAGIAAIVK